MNEGLSMDRRDIYSPYVHTLLTSSEYLKVIPDSPSRCRWYSRLHINISKRRRRG